MPMTNLYPLGLVLHSTEDCWWLPRLALHRELEIQRSRNLAGRRVSMAYLKLANSSARGFPKHPIDGADGVAAVREQTLHGTDPLQRGHFAVGMHHRLHCSHICLGRIQTGLAIEFKVPTE